jgi:hypothetical protein
MHFLSKFQEDTFGDIDKLILTFTGKGTALEELN